MFEPVVCAIITEIEKRGISQTEMARELGINQQTLNRIIRGEHRMGLVTAERVFAKRPQWRELINGRTNR